MSESTNVDKPRKQRRFRPVADAKHCGTILIVSSQRTLKLLYDTEEGRYCYRFSDEKRVCYMDTATGAWNFPFVNAQWEWVRIHPTATEQERERLNLFRLIGPEKWMEMYYKKGEWTYA